MRVWDRIRLGEWHPMSNGIEWERDPVVVIADEVTEMVVGGMKPEYPVVSPPWDDFVIEMKPSPWPFMVQFPWGVETATGVLVSFTNIKDDSFITPVLDELFGQGTQESAREAAHELRHAGGWVLGCELLVEFPRGIGPIAWLALAVHPDGSLYERVFARSHITQRELMFGEEDPETVAIEELVKPVLMAISLINCSNIGTVDTQGDYSRPERRALKRKDKSLFTFKRLHVKAHTTTRSTPSGEERKVAIHLVRGHFKHFTEDKSLFGKYTGTYWWQPMVRGTDQRFVIKDYEVDKDE